MRPRPTASVLWEALHMTSYHNICVTCPLTNWAIHSHSGTELGAGI